MDAVWRGVGAGVGEDRVVANAVRTSPVEDNRATGGDRVARWVCSRVAAQGVGAVVGGVGVSGGSASSLERGTVPEARRASCPCCNTNNSRKVTYTQFCMQ